MITFESIIFKNLFENREYISKVLPYLKDQYFTAQRQDQLIVFKIINAYVKKYNKMPTYSGIKTILQKQSKISETVFQSALDFLDEVESMKKDDWDHQWLLDETEAFCRLAAFENVLMQSMDKIEKKQSLSDMPNIMQDALAISFDTTLGIDYFTEASINERWERYHEKKEKFPCKIDSLNLITNGGVERKTLNLIMGDTSTGKTSALISLACDYIELGFKVAYFSFEMSEYKICHRVDARFLNTPINEIEFLDEEHYKETLNSLGFNNALFVKDYPTSMGNVSDIRLLLSDLKLKKGFVPDIVIIDYLNIMSSVRDNNSRGTYERVKNIAEEVRGLAVESNYVIWTATQTNRGASGKNDIIKSDTSESYGVPQSLDLLVGIIATDDMKNRGIQIWKDMKDRYTGSDGKKFVIKPNFETACARDFKGDTSDLIEEVEEVVRCNKRNERIANLRILNDDQVTTDKIKDEFNDILGDC